MLNLLDENKAEEVCPSKVILKFLIFKKHRSQVIDCDRREIQFRINKWKRNEIGKIKIGRKNDNEIVLDSDVVRRLHGLIDVKINHNHVLNFSYNDLGHGTILNKKLLNNKTSYLDNNSVLRFGDLNNGLNFEVKFGYELIL